MRTPTLPTEPCHPAATLALAAALVLIAFSAAYAEPPEPPEEPEVVEVRETTGAAPEAASTGTAPLATPVPAAGYRAYLDPRTGELTSEPTPAQVEALSRALAVALAEGAEAEPLRPFALRWGGAGVFLGDAFQVATRAVVGPDGALHIACLEDHDHSTGDHPGHPLAVAAPAPEK